MTLGDWLADELARAHTNANESHKAAPNSYGAGYDAGYRAAIGDVAARLSDKANACQIVEV